MLHNGREFKNIKELSVLFCKKAFKIKEIIKKAENNSIIISDIDSIRLGSGEFVYSVEAVEAAIDFMGDGDSSIHVCDGDSRRCNPKT
ncbi:MAG: hypothetical protein LBR15_02405 [Methanobrevibacter sp.]|jgi:hypothetical protein|nr:hypothetical protein [Candidatus Methanovirga australis]MDR2545867.1 hypothetical protein [Candidatus Methanovirga procula]